MVVLMNSTVMPCEGFYWTKKITEEEAKDIMLDYFAQPIESYVVFPRIASYMAEVLGVGVPINREQAVLEDGDVILVCKLSHEWWVVYYNTHKEG